ncbi:uncharacterized protein LOC121375475 isoform X2 [Gigantopelta aegis]|uniref:uncharacterized protein LOC121375475 isoform X1 n=1 Tax=Gigantopelta aegis TaxID=1735272 RepID=UPI001B888930|nr:uncharacterized protein LOC121375475 isoform X1 [Gigantopelta aegis]XP_041358880.1 uncharacterized protein LOC121375475 isoform X2 [Gigantopelta aegis]
MKKVGNLDYTISWLTLLIITWTHIIQGGIFPDKFGVVTPKDPFIYIGQNVSLFCNITTNHSNIESGQMTFEKDRIPVDRRYITHLGPRVIHLELPVTSLQDEGSYICILRKPEVLFLGVQYVSVEYPLKAIKSVECRVLGFETLSCNWTVIQYHHSDIIQSTLLYRIEYPLVFKGRKWQLCMNSSISSCFWPQGEFLFDFNIIMVIVTNNSVTGDSVISQQFNIMPKFCIQPYSVTDLKVTELNCSCLSLVWSDGIDSENQYLHKVQLTSQWNQDIQEFTTEEKHVTRCQLIPFTNYKISITRRMVESAGTREEQLIGWWSDPAIIEVKTDELAPVLVPESCVGCFTVTDNGQIIIYFQTLKSQDWYGTEGEYIINVTNLATGRTLTFSEPPSSNSFTFPEMSSAGFTAEIYTKNRAGISKNYTSFYIPDKNIGPQLPHNIVVELVNQTDMLETYHLTWTNISLLNGDDTNYTVYWCQRSLEQPQCMDKIFWKAVPSYKKDQYIQIPHDAFHTHLIGVSIEQHDSNGDVISSGIQWQQCVYNVNKAPQPPQKVHFLDHQSVNSLILAWTWPPCAVTSSVSHLVLTYCKLSDVSAAGNCSQPPVMETVPSDVDSYRIDSLDGGAVYRVHLQAVSQNRVGPRSNSIICEVRRADISGTPYNIFIIIIVVVSIACIAIVVIICRKKTKCPKFQPTYPKSKKEFDLYNQRINQRQILQRPESILVNNISEHYDPTVPRRARASQNAEERVLTFGHRNKDIHNTNRGGHGHMTQDISSSTEFETLIPTSDSSHTTHPEVHVTNRKHGHTTQDISSSTEVQALTPVSDSSQTTHPEVHDYNRKHGYTTQDISSNTEVQALIATADSSQNTDADSCISVNTFKYVDQFRPDNFSQTNNIVMEHTGKKRVNGHNNTGVTSAYSRSQLPSDKTVLFSVPEGCQFEMTALCNGNVAPSPRFKVPKTESPDVSMHGYSRFGVVSADYISPEEL